MALSITGRGTGGNTTAATTVAAVTTGVIAAGSLATLVVAYDNAGPGGSEPYVSIADARGNTWTSRVAVRNDPAGANAGLVLRIFTGDIQTALQIGDSVTVTFDTNVTAEVWGLREWTAGAGSHVEFIAPGEGTGTGTSPSITTGSITSGDAVLGAVGVELGTSQTYTADSDTTNGSWANHQTHEVGSNGAGMGFTSQTKIVTGTGTQTYNPTLGTSADYAIGWIQLREVPNPISGTSAVTAPNGTLAATGTARNLGASAFGAPAGEVAATGTVRNLGTSAVTAPSGEIAATGTAGDPPTPTGPADVTAPSGEIAGTGTVRVLGTSAITAPSHEVAATGALRLAATAAIEAPNATLAATGSLRTSGTAAVESPVGAIAATGELVVPDQDGEVELDIEATSSVVAAMTTHSITVSIENLHHVEVSVE